MGLSNIPNENKYIAIKTVSKVKKYPIVILCEILEISRSGYYKWLNGKKSKRELQNERLRNFIFNSYEERKGILGYRQMAIKIRRELEININLKRVYRLMKQLGLKSVCRRRRKRYIKSTPAITAENILNREFKATYINKKWLTDVTEFKYADGKRAYLSAILDVCDNKIISYVLGKSNNNDLVFQTLDIAKQAHKDAEPLFHSDRGFQYTSKLFKAKLDSYGMIQSMSRVGRCIDNSPMERFWGTLKTEMYYLQKFDTYNGLQAAVDEYINYYNNFRYQEGLNCLTPSEYRDFLTKSVA